MMLNENAFSMNAITAQRREPRAGQNVLNVRPAYDKVFSPALRERLGVLFYSSKVSVRLVRFM